MLASIRTLSLAAAALVAAGLPLADSASAQTLYGVDGAATMVDELTGPPGGACLYPNGPGVFAFPYMAAVPCLPLTPFAPPPFGFLGDVASDRRLDRAYVTDGKNIGVFTAAGVKLNSMGIGGLGIGALTGLGFDSAAGLLWMTDGLFIFTALPSAPGSCLPPILTGGFAPAGLGFVTDVSWHSPTGLLFACDAGGLIAAYTPGGAVVVPAYPAAISGCPLGPLTGIAADTASGCTGLVPALYVTDGFGVDYQLAGGFPAPATFYTPAACFPWAAGPTQGLEYVAHPISYGAGTGPVIGTGGGQSVLPNPAFTVTLTGAPPGGLAFLVYGTGAACPPFNFFGNPWLVNPWFGPLGPFPVPASGSITLPAPLPPPGGPLACGLSVYMQWLCRAPSLAWTVSQGLEFTTSIP